MTVTTVTSRELNRDVARAKRAAKAGPVFITDRATGAGPRMCCSASATTGGWPAGAAACWMRSRCRDCPISTSSPRA